MDGQGKPCGGETPVKCIPPKNAPVWIPTDTLCEYREVQAWGYGLGRTGMGDAGEEAAVFDSQKTLRIMWTRGCN